MTVGMSLCFPVRCRVGPDLWIWLRFHRILLGVAVVGGRPAKEAEVPLASDDHIHTQCLEEYRNV